MKEKKEYELVDLTSLENIEIGPNWEKPLNKSKKRKLSKNIINRKEPYKKINTKKNRENIKLNYDINITYNHDFITKVKEKIRKSGITYSVEEITNTIISEKVRLTFKLDSENEFFHISRIDGKIFITEKETIDHIISNLTSIIETSETVSKKPNGNFGKILKCPDSTKLLPPKSYHDFEKIIYKHKYENKIGTDYGLYINKLISVEDKELIEQWKKTPIDYCNYKFVKEFDKGKKFDSIKSVINDIRGSLDTFRIKKRKILLSGSKLNLLNDKLVKQVEDFYYNGGKWKKDLFFNILINLKKSGFLIFKNKTDNKMYASPYKTKKYINSEISKNCNDILKVIQDNEAITKKDLLNININKELRKDIVLYELKWLLKEGYIKIFKNGLITLN